MESMVLAMVRELHLRRHFLKNERVETIYFGGGTPSLLPSVHIEHLLDTVRSLFELSNDPEVTLEANPDDISIEKLGEWKKIGINRLSIGIQTFDDDRLHFLNRAHNGKEAIQSVKMAQDLEFDNITCDLIYAIPPDSMDKWVKDIATMIDLEVPHLSLYGLTVEPETVFGKWQSTGKIQEVSESANAEQYAYAIETLTKAGYEHYEVSNFCQPLRHSRHNSSYWLQKTYLGIGPGAHSYDGQRRSFAPRNNALYIKALEKDDFALPSETLSPIQKANEYMLTRIRTRFGIDPEQISDLAQQNFLLKFRDQLHRWIDAGLMEKKGQIFRLTSAGMMNADEIALKLFLDES